MSSFTDDELAEIRLDRSGEFSEDESNFAGGTLGARMTVSLRAAAPDCDALGDRRALMMGIKALYSQMSDNVRAALGWTPAMMVSTDNQLNIDSKKLGWLSIDSMIPTLLDASDKGGLHFTRDRFDALPQMGPDQSSKTF